MSEGYKNKYTLTLHEVNFLERKLIDYNNQTTYEHQRITNVTDYMNQIIRTHIHREMLREEQSRTKYKRQLTGLEKLLVLCKIKTEEEIYDPNRD